MTEKDRAGAVYKLLLEEFGIPTWEKRPALDELVLTILSQNTNDRNRDIAYIAMRENYPTWEEVKDAHEDELIKLIRVAGLANQKGPRIQAVLKKIDQEFNQLNLDFMRDWERERVYKYLVNLKGVGPKTASIVMLFSLNLPAFPVDTHVYRVTGRIGIRPLKISVENSHEYLASCFNSEEYRTAHINLIYLGRRICKARKPACQNCPIRGLCLYPEKSDSIIKG